MENKKNLPFLTDGLGSLDSGLDSPVIAILVARLEEVLGIDPLIESERIEILNALFSPRHLEATPPTSPARQRLDNLAGSQ